VGSAGVDARWQLLRACGGVKGAVGRFDWAGLGWVDLGGLLSMIIAGSGFTHARSQASEPPLHRAMTPRAHG
jgi:hypothetical protein